MTAIHRLETLDPGYRPVREHERSGIYPNNYMGPAPCRSSIPTLTTALSASRLPASPTCTGDFTLLLPVLRASAQDRTAFWTTRALTHTRAKVELFSINFFAIF